MGWYGMPDVKYQSHGEWSDPCIWYRGFGINYYDLEDLIYSDIEEYAEDTYGSYDDNKFYDYLDEYCKNRNNWDYIYSSLNDIIDGELYGGVTVKEMLNSRGYFFDNVIEELKDIVADKMTEESDYEEVYISSDVNNRELESYYKDKKFTYEEIMEIMEDYQ